MKTVKELHEWRVGAVREFGDPSIPVTPMFVRLQTIDCRSEEITAKFDRGILFVNAFADIPLVIDVDGPQIEDGCLRAFGIVQVVPGLWFLTPSLNLPDMFHAFIVLYDVPSPAPWEATSSIVVVSR